MRVDTHPIIPEILIIHPTKFEDHRGYFYHSYNQKTYNDAGITNKFVEDYQSFSHACVFRGLHYQLGHPQAKLVRVVKGEVIDFMIDIRVGSPTFGKIAFVNLSAENNLQVLVPKDFAHGFYAFEDAVFQYKVDEIRYPSEERTLRYNDPMLGLKHSYSNTIMSDKDKNAPDVTLSDLPKFLDK